MGGGDKVTTHNCTRDTVYEQAQAANVAPVLKAPGVLSGFPIADEGAAGGQDGDRRRRTADVLVCRAQDIRTGAGGARGRAKVALDMGIVCLQAPGHLWDASAGILGAAEAYCITKCGRDGTEQRCRERGVEFQPLIFESTGGAASEAEVVLKGINRLVAQNRGVSVGDVATRFWQRVSVDMQRNMHRALVRRGARS